MELLNWIKNRGTRGEIVSITVINTIDLLVVIQQLKKTHLGYKPQFSMMVNYAEQKAGEIDKFTFELV